MDYLTMTEYNKIMKQCINSYTKEELLTVPAVYQALSKQLHENVLKIYAEKVKAEIKYENKI